LAVILSDSSYSSEDGVFKNKFGITDGNKLLEVEYQITAQRAGDLDLNPDLIQASKFDLPKLQSIHKHLFNEIYEWAGKIRTVPSSKRAENGFISRFSEPENIIADWQILAAKIDALRDDKDSAFLLKKDALADIFIEANSIHPFPEGNGRSLQVFMTQLAKEENIELDFKKATPSEWNLACSVSGKHFRLFEHVHKIELPPNPTPIKKIFNAIATPAIVSELKIPRRVKKDLDFGR